MDKYSLYDLFGNVFKADFSIKEEVNKKIMCLGENSEYGTMEIYSIFPGVFLAYIDFNIQNPSEIFVDEYCGGRFLEINHCICGRYAYSIDDSNLIYFGKGDLCVGIPSLTRASIDFPLGYYKGLEIFIDVDIANDYIKNYISDFDLIEFYNNLKRNNDYVLIKSNEKIDHVIGELYNVDDRIKESYFKLKTAELLLFFSITNFNNFKSVSLSKIRLK